MLNVYLSTKSIFDSNLSVNTDVIHTVGPRGENPDSLKSCYENCLSLMAENGLRTIVSKLLGVCVYFFVRTVSLYLVNKSSLVYIVCNVAWPMGLENEGYNLDQFFLPFAL